MAKETQDMHRAALRELSRYWDVYEFLGTGPKSRDEMFIQGMKLHGRSTAYDYVRKVFVTGLPYIIVENEQAMIDPVQWYEMLYRICVDFHFDPYEYLPIEKGI